MADISRAEVATLIQEAYNNTLLEAAVQGSTVLQAFPTVDMGTKVTHLPVLATLPTAEFVNGDNAPSPTSKVTWADSTLVAEEIKVVIPVPENVLDDASVAILENVAHLGGQAIGKALDEAVIFEVGKPASWVSPGLLAAAVSSGQMFENVSGNANESDLVGASNKAAEAIAMAGYAPNTLLSSLALRYQVANLRDSLGQLVFRDNSFNGFSTYFNENGAWDNTSAAALIVDSKRVRIGVRQDITVKFLDQATIGTGVNQINLADQDMVALRLKARFAYVLGKGATPMGENKTPVAAVVPESDES